MKKRRIRIYKQTLRLLGDPEYIYFLVNERKRVLGIRASESKDPPAQKIYWEVLEENGQCCEFYSTYFIEKLKTKVIGFEEQRTMKAIGKWNSKMQAIVFDLSSMTPVGDETI